MSVCQQIMHTHFRHYATAMLSIRLSMSSHVRVRIKASRSEDNLVLVQADQSTSQTSSHAATTREAEHDGSVSWCDRTRAAVLWTSVYAFEHLV
jgi:hypothetical protein